MEAAVANDPTIAAIADRLRSVFLIRSLAHLDKLNELGDELGVSASRIGELLQDRERLIDPGLLVELVAIAVHDEAVHPNWLLTGDYDLATHQGALVLAEEGRDRKPGPLTIA
jgi:hypothetical protein